MAFAAGVGLGTIAPAAWAPWFVVLGAVAPIPTFLRPTRRTLAPIGPALAAGVVLATAPTPACDLPDTGPWIGRFEATPRSGSARMHPVAGCGAWTVVLGRSMGAPPAGTLVLVEGEVVEGRYRPWIAAKTIERVDESTAGFDRGAWRWSWVRWRDRRVDQVHRLYGDRGPLVAALLFARREGLDPEVRDAFAAAGIAHLLAISGFHVGVLAVLLTQLSIVARVPRRMVLSAVALGVWAYVGLIGAPDAAFRAAVILTAVVAARGRGRPSSRWAPLASAALILLLLDPTRIASPGAQLSFAGAAGLVAWSGGWGRDTQRYLDRRFPLARRLPRGWLSPIAAGCAATLATMPIAAWHFERVSWVGVPVTLLATPLVSAAMPGALLSLVLEPLAPGAAAFVAGGTAVLLDVVTRLAASVASVPWMVFWASQADVMAVMVGVAVAAWIARSPHVGREGRRLRTVLLVVAVSVVAPVARSALTHGTLEIRMLDVGQGDAVAVRTPRGRWILVDAGPPTRGSPLGQPVVRALRRAGVGALELMVLTHADADHFGGAEAVLAALPVARIVDPGLPVGKEGYVELLGGAAKRGVPWSPARVGDRLEVDGVGLTVLAPSDSAVDRLASSPGPPDANEASVILLLEWRGFRALLTGDAFKDAERAVMERVGDIDVLKVGHHGSDTSSDADFLDAVKPEWALISVGRNNRYGHPSPDVVRRLKGAASEVLRTDTDGEIRVVVRRSGRLDVRTARDR